MDRREVLGTLGATAAGLFLVTGTEARAQHEGHYGKAHQDCLKACQDCSRTCNETFHHCYRQVAEGRRDHARALHFVADCAKFCDLSASLTARRSPLMIHACTACAAACKACAAECEKFDSPEMQDCVKACRACEAACREMVKAMETHAR
jgi:hypothetical protein